MHLSTIPLLILPFLHSSIASTTQLHHRIVLPLPTTSSSSYQEKSSTAWTTRGSLTISSSDTSPIPTISFDSEGVEPLYVSIKGEEDWRTALEEGWYQVAIQRDGVEVEEWARSGVRLCHLLTTPPPAQIIHIALSSSDATPYSISQSLYPPSTTCPSSILDQVTDGNTLERLISSIQWDGMNVTVVSDVGYPTQSPILQPSIPLQIDPLTNLPIQQDQVEKSFVQKYWMYMIGGLLAITLLLGGDEGKGGPPGGGGAGRR